MSKLVIVHGGEGSSNFDRASRSAERIFIDKHVKNIIDEFGYSFEDMIKMAGNPKGADVYFDISTIYDEDTYITPSQGVRVTVRHPDYEAVRTFNLEDKFIYNNWTKSYAKGAGTRAFAEEVRWATKMDFKYILNTSARSKDLFGYKFWPLLGYDGSLPDWIARDTGKETIQELHETQEGRDYWVKYGGTVDLKFDLTPNSLSHQILAAYLKRKGITVYGGTGSGNFDHAGRPGKVGGSASNFDAEEFIKNLHLSDEVLEVFAEFYPDREPKPPGLYSEDAYRFDSDINAAVKIAGMQDVSHRVAREGIEPKDLHRFLNDFDYFKPRGNDDYERSVDIFFHGWAENDRNLTRAVERRAAEVFDLKDYNEYEDDIGENTADVYSNVIDPILRGVYARTQEKIKDWPDTVTVYRGFISDGDYVEKGYSEEPISFRPLASFSLSFDTAFDFSTSNIRMQRNPLAVVVAIEVPKESIMSVPGVGFGCINEAEIVALGGTYNAKILARNHLDRYQPVSKSSFWRAFR